MFVREDLKKLIMFTIKSIIVFLLVIAVPLFMIFMSAIFTIAFSGVGEEQEDLVYVVDFKGSIQEGTADFMSPGITPSLVNERLSRVEEAPGAEAVVLRVNSPGGSIAASQEIAKIIDDFELPVVISMGDTVASGGYYISAPADYIMANQGTTTGSIGVISVIMSPEGLYEKLGIEVEVITSGEYKALGFDSLSEEEKQLIQDMSDEFYEQFVSSVSDYRGMEKEEVYELATGQVFTGQRAYENGLVDDIGSLKASVEKAGELAGVEEPKKVRLDTPGLLQNLIQITDDFPRFIKRLTAPDELEYYFEMDENMPFIFKYKHGF